GRAPNPWASITGVASWTNVLPVDSVVGSTAAQTVYASAGGLIWVTTDHGANWASVAPINPVPAGIHYSAIAIDPVLPNIAYAVVSNVGDLTGNRHVFRTTDSGMTWNDISGNFPNLPAWSIALNAPGPGFANDTIYVGTDAGVYQSTGNGMTWTRTAAG